MKQTKWLVNLSACLVLMAVSAVGAKGKLAGPRGAREQGASIRSRSLPAFIRSGRRSIRSSHPLRYSPSLPDWIRSGRGRIPY